MRETVKWDGKVLWILDQTRLPLVADYVPCDTAEKVAIAIRDMLVRGAPAIGVTAAFGMVLGSREISDVGGNVASELERYKNLLDATRPTAINLFWATERMINCARECSGENVLPTLETFAREIYRQDIESCRAIGRYGAEVIPDGATILTHCNAGALATAGYGTALGVVRGAVEAGKRIRVFADETRPFLQGARLTAWELLEDNIETYLITDNMAAHFMARGEIDVVVVGADRIVANGDAANKIGTYSVALAASAHEIPFYVAAPVSTIDLNLRDGSLIPIEERDPREVTHLGDIQIAPDNVKVKNPAFDVTPNRYITGIVTDRGLVSGDYTNGLKSLFEI